MKREQNEGSLREVKEELGIALDSERGYLFKSFRREKFTWANPDKLILLGTEALKLKEVLA